MEQPALCERLIDGFYAAKELGFSQPGMSARGLDKSWKDSEDVSINCLPMDDYSNTVHDYFAHVMASHRLYLAEFPELARHGAKVGFLDPPQIQHYEPGGAFFGDHYESSGLDISHRVLAFLTSLNDIKEGGGTEFIDQKFVCPPERGVTKIWPAGFTHTHHGVPAPTEDKFIITGWLSYIGS
ncbi:MAG: 2OG-Fe(II) oxygenase [Rhodospirillaceae bacterium]|nr:2OG-Fe(II) oxygenase [Rhodospirillaceae bacterium]MBT5677693.1 2OG-Fe(II) oxygenase [Rhodospirillaceae bacterium]MBT7293139.1 2OG-Fe(II) oxygenase [Rhodospirillaceae bacterium]